MLAREPAHTIIVGSLLRLLPGVWVMWLISPRRSPRPDSSARIWVLKNPPHSKLLSQVVWLYLSRTSATERGASIARRPSCRPMGKPPSHGWGTKAGAELEPEPLEIKAAYRRLPEFEAVRPGTRRQSEGAGEKHGAVSALLSGWQGGCQEKHDKSVSTRRRRWYGLGNPPLVNPRDSGFAVKEVSGHHGWAVKNGLFKSTIPDLCTLGLPSKTRSSIMPRPHSRGILQTPTGHLVHQNVSPNWRPDFDEEKGPNLQPPEIVPPKGPITTRCSEV